MKLRHVITALLVILIPFLIWNATGPHGGKGLSTSRTGILEPYPTDDGAAAASTATHEFPWHLATHHPPSPARGPYAGNTKARDAALQILTNAAACVRLIHELRDHIPPEQQNARRQLEGLARRLFVDDWRLMALLDPSLEGRSGEAAFDELNAGQPLDDSFLPTSQVEADPVSGLALLNQHYQQCLEQSQISGFGEIESRLTLAVPDHLARYPGLLKDAWMYVAARTEVQDWRQDEIQSLNDSAYALRGLSRPEQMERVAGFFERTQESLDRCAASLAAAYDQVFLWRLQHMHGLQGAGALLPDLAAITLRGASPTDLQTPLR